MIHLIRRLGLRQHMVHHYIHELVEVLGAQPVPAVEPDQLLVRRLERVLTNDPGIGVARHADAGYESAFATAAREGIRIPMKEFRIRRVPCRPFSRSSELPRILLTS